MLHWWRKFFGQPAGVSAGAGERGEELAARWLQREKAFRIVARNWRNPRDRRDELDVVCRDGEVLVFVEVKARAAGALVPGYFAVDRRKKRVLLRTIKAYLAGLREKPRSFRFDVVEVSVEAAHASAAANPRREAGGEPTVLHFENVPLFSKHFRA